MGFLALLLLPKCSTDLNYGLCPPARDWGSRVSGLVKLVLGVGLGLGLGTVLGLGLVLGLRVGLILCIMA